MRRMYGDFEMTTTYGPPTQTSRKKRRHTEHFDIGVPGVPDLIGAPGAEPGIDEKGDSFFNKWRTKRQSQSFRGSNANASNNRNNQSNRRGNQSQTTSNQNERQTSNQSENTGR